MKLICSIGEPRYKRDEILWAELSEEAQQLILEKYGASSHYELNYDVMPVAYDSQLPSMDQQAIDDSALMQHGIIARSA